MNWYTSSYQKQNFSWYERDGLITYTDQLKYEQFITNPDNHFANAEIVSFDIIHHRCWGDPLKNSVRSYRTIDKKHFENYSSESKTRAISAVARNGR